MRPKPTSPPAPVLRVAWPPVLRCALAAALAVGSGSLSQAQPSTAPVASSRGLPSLGDGTDLDIAAERRLGDSIAQQIYRDPDYLDDPVLGDYLQGIWAPLLAAARTRGDLPPDLSERLAWELMVSRDKRVNAFALPGGYMGVNLGLLAVTETPQELASVLAHELSHVSQRHIARLITQQEKQAPLILGALILGVLAARDNIDVANAAIAGSQAAAVQSRLNFSRDMEREADRVGFGVLTTAGFDNQGFVDMFNKLQQGSRLNDDGAFPYLRSHPLTTERIGDMRARAALAPRQPARAVPPKGAASSNSPLDLSLPGAGSAPVGNAAAPAAPAAAPPATSAQHALMAARARVLAENGPDRWRAWLSNGQAAKASAGERYAAAMSAWRLGQTELALSLAQRLREQATPDTRGTLDALLLELLLVRNKASRGGADAAQQAQLNALRDAALTSGQRAGLLLGAEAAMATNAPAPAAERLQTWVVGHPRDALAWQTLSRVHAANGQRLRALRAEAEARAAQLDFSGAVDRFRAALALPAADQAADRIELAIVDVRLRAVQEQLREAERESLR